MCSLINKQLLLTAYAYLFIMEQQKGQQGSEALQLKSNKGATQSLSELQPCSAKSDIGGYCIGSDAGVCGGGAVPVQSTPEKIKEVYVQFRQKVKSSHHAERIRDNADLAKALEGSCFKLGETPTESEYILVRGSGKTAYLTLDLPRSSWRPWNRVEKKALCFIDMFKPGADVEYKPSQDGWIPALIKSRNDGGTYFLQRPDGKTDLHTAARAEKIRQPKKVAITEIIMALKKSQPEPMSLEYQKKMEDWLGGWSRADANLREETPSLSYGQLERCCRESHVVGLRGGRPLPIVSADYRKQVMKDLKPLFFQGEQQENRQEETKIRENSRQNFV